VETGKQELCLRNIELLAGAWAFLSEQSFGICKNLNPGSSFVLISLKPVKPIGKHRTERYGTDILIPIGRPTCPFLRHASIFDTYPKGR